MDSLTAATWQIAEVTDLGITSVRPIGIGPFTIGRASDCDWIVKDRTVSRYHAHIFWRHGDWFVCDLKSAGGTIADGRVVTSSAIRLVSGSEIQIPGMTLVMFERSQLRVVERLDRRISLHKSISVTNEQACDRVRVTPVLQRVLYALSSRDSLN
jgi:pSer/pThr/pTyr-binding forkhead associated (FHA) protein